MKGGAGESTCRGEFSSQQAAQNHLELQLQMTCCPLLAYVLPNKKKNKRERERRGRAPTTESYLLTDLEALSCAGSNQHL